MEKGKFEHTKRGKKSFSEALSLPKKIKWLFKCFLMVGYEREIQTIIWCEPLKIP